jgi:nitrogen fixation/metabolism regulation signal transduction histidine kinase
MNAATPNADVGNDNVICPSCAAPFTNGHTSTDSVPRSSTHLPSTPSNILLGIQGLQRLFAEFQTALVEKEGRIARMESEVEVHLSQVNTEREMALKALKEKEEMRRDLNAIKADDESASKVVERYM